MTTIEECKLKMHRLPEPFATHSTSSMTLVAQGAEALIYQTTFLTPNNVIALKVRPPKPYRHAVLDARLTKHRILSEARILVRARREGIDVPGVQGVGGWEADARSGEHRGGWMAMEWIDGLPIRKVLDMWMHDREEEDNNQLKDLMRRIGVIVARLHSIGIVHGDLTTSNLILRPCDGTRTTANDQKPSLSGTVVLIDFGLASGTVQDEDRAVDLYVLERAFASTHPRAETLFADVLTAYASVWTGGRAVLKKLEEVRGRGRKRSMLG